MIDLLPVAANLTRLDLAVLIFGGVAMLCVPVLLHLIGEDQRDQRQHRRKREAHRAGVELAQFWTEAYVARRQAAAAHDEEYAAAVRAERDEAHRLAVQMLAQADQLRAELAETRAQLVAATNVVHRQNRANLGHLARLIEAEADQTLQLPAVTRELPRLPAGRRRVLEGIPA